MRALVLLIGVLSALGITLAYPYVGVLLWSWFTLQQPHREVYGLAQAVPLNYIIAVVTLVACFFSKERIVPSTGFIFWMLVIFLCWVTFNSFFAFDPAWSWPYWDRTWKTFFLGLVIAATATSRMRLYALAWVAVISLFFYGVKGGLFTILTGGNFHVLGPPGTIIGDNNQLAAALLMTLPFANYLRAQVSDKRIAYLLIAGMILTIISIVGSYSRGAIIGLGALALFMLLRVRKRYVYLALAGLLTVFVATFMPESFFHRMDTITTATQDLSFESRLYSWRVAFFYARDHFPFGTGFYGQQLPGIYQNYYPDRTPHAAHSIYFQVLSEQGFVGLGIYLIILTAAFLTCARIIAFTRAVPEQQWAHDLSIAIQASLFVFCVAGAALSMAYYDLFIIDLAMLLSVREIVLMGAKRNRAAWSPPNAAVASR